MGWRSNMAFDCWGSPGSGAGVSAHRPPIRPATTAADMAVSPLPLVSSSLSVHDIVARYGKCSISPFLAGPGQEVIALSGGGIGSYARCGRWAVAPTGPAVATADEQEGLDEFMIEIRRQRLRPVFAAVSNPDRFARMGMHCTPIAEDPIVVLDEFDLAGKRRASIRHSVAAAIRAGLIVKPYTAQLANGVGTVSAAWLRTKRGGEMGFTLGRWDPDDVASVDSWVALDADERVVGFVTWRRFDDGGARVLDLMRRHPDAPNPTMDFLIAESLAAFASTDVRRASLGSVPLSHGHLAERVYATRSLRRFKDKFAPEWRTHHLVAPSSWASAAAGLAVCRAYSPEGLLKALHRNA